jgi:hypothetical protein
VQPLSQSLVETRRRRKVLRSLVGRTPSLTPQNRPRARRQIVKRAAKGWDKQKEVVLSLKDVLGR